MTPSDYRIAFMEPNYNEYLEEPGSLTRAFNAAHSCNHFLDHYFKYNRRYDPEVVAQFSNFGAFIESVRTKCPAVGVIRDISNVLKHLYSDRTNAYVQSGGSLYVETDAFTLSDTDGAESEVFYTLPSGEKKSFKKTLETAYSFLNEMEP